MFYPTEEFKYENVKNFISTTNDSTYELLTTKEEYTNHSKTKLKVKHLTCGNVFEVDCHHFVKANNRCPKCNKEKYFKTKTEEQFKEDVFKAVGDEYTVKGKYINKSTKIELLHNKCGHIYIVTPGHFLNTGCRCTYCRQSSRGETLIKKILEDEIEKVTFLKEFRFENLYNLDHTNRLEFDFALFSKSEKLLCLIEYDGPQHERPTPIFGTSLEEAEKIFKKQVQNDNLKNEFCEKNGIPLIRIKYNKSKNLKKVRDKINDILGRLNDYPELEYTTNQKF